MSYEIEIDDDLKERLDDHLEKDESYAELIEELVNIYESTRFAREGYSE